jgi:uncharacterized protein YutE (UPF0331/DUF86 family)
MVNKLLVERILNDLNTFSAELREVQNISFAEYRADVRLRRYIERTVHIAIESVIDIAQHILADNGWREADSYRECFIVLHERGVVSEDLLAKLIKMAAFHNLLVHYYEKIDDAIVFSILKTCPDDFTAYTEQIVSFISKKQ